MELDITGIDRVALLRKMWDNVKPAVFFTMNGIPTPSFDETLVGRALTDYIDYFCGRAIKSDLSKDVIDMTDSTYNRNAGAGRLEEIVRSFRTNAPLTSRKTILMCPYEENHMFDEFGGPMIPNDLGTIMCSHCGYIKRQHIPLFI